MAGATGPDARRANPAPETVSAPTLGEAKAALRREVLARWQQLTAAARAAGSAEACARLERQPCWRQARAVLLYAPVGMELDVWPLVLAALAAGKLVALPRFDSATQRYAGCQITEPERDLASGRYGIREPAAHCARLPLNRLDFILVPGVAFDLHGRRLGRGKGYFDQMLAEPHGATCGVAFEEQLVRQVPVAPHDISVNCILTPSRWVEV